MFVSRALRTTQSGHRYTSSAKFTNTREINHDQVRISEVEDHTHPNRSLACAFASFLFCPILGFIALFYGIRAVRTHNQGFYAEATTFYKKAIRWSLITFVIGLIIGSIVLFSFFVKAVVFV